MTFCDVGNLWGLPSRVTSQVKVKVEIAGPVATVMATMLRHEEYEWPRE